MSYDKAENQPDQVLNEIIETGGWGGSAPVGANFCNVLREVAAVAAYGRVTFHKSFWWIFTSHSKASKKRVEKRKFSKKNNEDCTSNQ